MLKLLPYYALFYAIGIILMALFYRYYRKKKMKKMENESTEANKHTV